MRDDEIISKLIELSRTISKYTVGFEGNVSCRMRDGILVKASGKSLCDLKPEDLVFFNGKNTYVDSSNLPSIESGFHLWLVQRVEAQFVCHVHPVNTLKILCGDRIDEFSKKRLFPDQVVFNGIESCVIDYFHPGGDLLKGLSREIPEFIERIGSNPKLILLKNHGIITFGKTIQECIISAEICEKSAEIFLGCYGGHNFLSDEDVQRLIDDENEKYRQDLLK